MWESLSDCLDRQMRHVSVFDTYRACVWRGLVKGGVRGEIYHITRIRDVKCATELNSTTSNATGEPRGLSNRTGKFPVRFAKCTGNFPIPTREIPALLLGAAI